MSCKIIDPLNYPNYNALLLERDDSLFFHSANWAQVLNRTYKYQPLYFSIVSNGNLTALLTLMGIKSPLTGNRAVSLPFTDFCYPISSESKDFETLFDNAIVYGRKAKWKTLEIRGETCHLMNVSPFALYYLHELKLNSSKKNIFSKFRSSTRRNILKAEKKGVTANVCYSWESLREFYRLHCSTRKRHGIPPQPLYFFEAIYKHIISPGNGLVVLSHYNSKPIAGAVYFHFGQNVIYKYGASNRKFLHLRANNLVMWTAIKWYVQNGFQIFSFGRTAPTNTGLLQFKRGWGTDERTIRYFKYDLLRKRFVKEKPEKQIIHFLFRRLPLPLLSLTGRLLYKHVG